MSELRTLLADTVTRLFTDLVTKEALEAAEQGAWPDRLWQALEEGGLTLSLVPEAAGGAGGTWADAYVVVRAAGRHAAPVPLAETIVAGWLLAGAGLPVPLGPLTLAPVRTDDRLRLSRVQIIGYGPQLFSSSRRCLRDVGANGLDLLQYVLQC
jgi:acyl-CoA dehydrogenase